MQPQLLIRDQFPGSSASILLILNQPVGAIDE